jgi:membrane protease YdiL (CAAX protease family)
MTNRLVAWTVFVGFFATLAYIAHFNGDRPAKDVAYRWGSSISGAVFYGVFLGVVLLLTRGLDRRAFLGLRRPNSWARAGRISVLVVVAVAAVSAAVAPFGDPGKEQGLIPERFDSSRIAQFAAYVAVVAVVGPIVEELTFRGVGYGLLVRFGETSAILLVGLAFGLVHGLVAGFPVIATFGIGLAYLRSRTQSVYPCIVLHACFNAAGLALGVAT